MTVIVILMLLMVAYVIGVEVYEDQAAWLAYVEQKKKDEEEAERYELEQIMSTQTGIPGMKWGVNDPQ